MTHLTEQFHIPREYHAACSRILEIGQRHLRRLLKEEYWRDRHLEAIQSHDSNDHTYVRDDEYEPFEDTDAYLYNRFKRCIYHRVTRILKAHREKYRAFRFIVDTVEEQKIRRVGWQQLRSRLFDSGDSPYIQWSNIETIVEQLNNHYDRHGRFPEVYTDLVDCPQPDDTVPFGPDSRGDIHEVQAADGEIVVMLKAPDSLSPNSYADWTEHEIRFPAHQRFNEMLETGELKAPTLHSSEHGYTLDVPVDVPEASVDTTSDRVLAVDLGVKKQATAVVLDGSEDGKEESQIVPPNFVDHHAKDKLFRVKADAEGIDSRLAELRQQGKSHTKQFAHLLSEYRRTRRKERRLRDQIQHDVANQLVWLATVHECETIVLESLGQLEAEGTGGVTAWSISTWAHGKLLELLRYKSDLLGIDVETVNPWGTSRYCPRCGERGKTVKAPTDHTELRNGGHFYCPSCEYECDRDVVGAVNVGRKHLSGSRMETANPCVYTARGNHASFPSRPTCERVRSEAGTEDSETVSVPGVQSAANSEQDPASGRQTRLSEYRSSSLTTTRSRTEGGLQQNQSRKTGLRCPSRSITRQCLLASTTDSHEMLPNPAEN